MKHLSILKALEAYEQTSAHLGLERFAAALAVSLVAAFVTAGLYRLFYENRGTGSQISRSFALLSLAITTLFVCIQVSIPLPAHGPLDHRFRTPIKEPGRWASAAGDRLLGGGGNLQLAFRHPLHLRHHQPADHAAGALRPLLQAHGLLVMTLPDTAIGNMEGCRPRPSPDPP